MPEAKADNKPAATAPAPAAPQAAHPATAAAPTTDVIVKGIPVQAPKGPPKPVGETVPGGRYFVSGRWVDANGNPRKEDEGLDEHGNPAPKQDNA